MCSSTRGPAIAPVLVTWPTRKMGMPFTFASRSSAEAHRLTWLTLPADDSSSSEAMAWIESTIASAGFSASICARIGSRATSERTKRLGC